MQNFLSILDLDPDRIAQLLESAAKLKRERVKGMKAPTWNALNGKHVGLLFEKPSLRTRVTFTIGGEATRLSPGDCLFAVIDRPTRFDVPPGEPAEYLVIQEPA